MEPIVEIFKNCEGFRSRQPIGYKRKTNISRWLRPLRVRNYISDESLKGREVCFLLQAADTQDLHILLSNLRSACAELY